MLVRVRRYRVFLLAVILTVLGLYYLADSNGWSSRLNSYTPSSGSGQSFFKGYDDSTPDEQSGDGPDSQTTEHLHTPVLQEQSDAETPPSRVNLPGPHHLKEPTELSDPFSQAGTAPKIHPITPAKLPLAQGPKFDEDRIAPPVSSATPSPSPSSSVIHWSSQAQKYPVSSTIQLPTGKATPIPRVQAAFGNEDPASQATREQRQAAVKAAMKKHWTGYKAFAWGHDELQPISEGFSDPFAGWGATLVDSLDTLWIMGLKEEFEEAVKAVAKIDFTTTELKRELPLFEVTIRYLGGLLAAYDLSAAKYPILLEKAIELGEILYGAFDTENRMPITYYKWQPENVRRFHRAGTSVVLAELGTLSMEFTRLAQLSKEPKYYDAIARVTDAIYDFQNKTSLPGMWPLYIDASGCANQASQSSLAKAAVKYGYTNWGGALPKKPVSPPSSDRATNPPTVPDSLGHLGDSKATEAEEALNKRVAASYDYEDDVDDEDTRATTPEGFKCGATTLRSSSASVSTFTLGGMADSVYEYLPKEYLLLGVGNGQYREMHENAMTPIKEFTLYRPMIEDEKRNIRFTGKYTTIGAGIVDEDGRPTGTLDTSTGHLACFAGGMVGLGAKIFNRPDEMELAEQLTDGCVWAYEATATGIMAEDIYPVACDSMQSCKWNETKWYELVDPYAEEQLQREWEYYEKEMMEFNKSKPSSAEDVRKALLEPQPLPIPEKQLADLDRRQLNEQALEEFTGSAEDVAIDTIPAKLKAGSRPASSQAPQPTVAMPEKPPTLAEHMAEKVKNDRLAPGISRWGGRNYILRPEAIESVFYMYRITGDKKWQDKGWKMWQAIDKHTSVDNGNSAIADVTSVPAVHMDKAESFWTGETLKYFYLLYSEPSLVSLDDYVLNTEAHPFLRPDAKLKKT